MLKLPTLASMIYFLILSWATLWMGATSGARTTLFLSEACMTKMFYCYTAVFRDQCKKIIYSPW
jgi:hypothetical protein